MLDQHQIETLIKSAFWELLGNRESLQGRSLVPRLAKATGLDELTVRGALGGLAQQKWLGGVSVQGISVGNVFPLTERPIPAVPASLTRWVETLNAADLNAEEVRSLSGLHSLVEDVDSEDQAALVAGLLRLRSAQASYAKQPSFLVSAAFLLGSSKILDHMAPTALKAFGIHPELFTGAPSVVLTAGPGNPTNVVLVENPHAFWRAIGTAALETTAFIVTFGYGLSRHSDDYGNQLASVLEGKSPLVGAVCGGTPPAISSLLNHPEIFFWGDLDVEGVKIYRRLKNRISRLELSALYTPMIYAASNRSTSHPYIKAAAKHKQRKIDFLDDTCCRYLIESCRSRAVDQEIVTCDEIVKYSRMALCNKGEIQASPK